MKVCRRGTYIVEGHQREAHHFSLPGLTWVSARPSHPSAHFCISCTGSHTRLQGGGWWRRAVSGYWRRRIAADVRASEYLGWGQATGVGVLSVATKGSPRLTCIWRGPRSSLFFSDSSFFIPYFLTTGKSDLTLSTLDAIASLASKQLAASNGTAWGPHIVSCAIQPRQLPLESFLYWSATSLADKIVLEKF